MPDPLQHAQAAAARSRHEPALKTGSRRLDRSQLHRPRSPPMADLIIDASVAAAWRFKNEAAGYTEHILDALAGVAEPIAPRLWAFEIRNSILSGGPSQTHRSVGRTKSFFIR